MKALRFYDIEDLRLEEAPKPKARGKEILLSVASVGICGSDIHYFKEGGTGTLTMGTPFVLGHEFSAWVADGPEQGQLVAVDPALPCGKCEFCQEGNPNLCLHLKFAGAEDTDGGLQEHLLWDRTAIFSLPRSFSPQEGAMLEPLGVVIHALNLGKVSPGMNVGVFGAGTIGLLIVQMARIAGASRIFVTDPLSHRLEFARMCGATDTILADDDEVNKINTATSGRGVDVAFEAAGDDGTAVETAVQSSKRGGALILIGIPSQDKTVFTASEARRRGLTIKLARRMKNTYPTAIRLVEAGQVDLKCLITAEFPLEDFDKAFQTAVAREGVKVVINLSI
jgi:L-iditol 2-dehydrogenase